MYDRLIKHRIKESLEDTPVVLVVGPRRAGKTTLVQDIESDSRTYFTLDDPATLEAAHSDPVGFVRRLERATIDEIQRAP
ncbi:MAG: AAA family ATPase, partial [Boseongicola sp. SB0662_bin_57]|nr:AAA family ATPase [Boseongicola sp. SB0662_bin_57]